MTDHSPVVPTVAATSQRRASTKLMYVYRMSGHPELRRTVRTSCESAAILSVVLRTSSSIRHLSVLSPSDMLWINVWTRLDDPPDRLVYHPAFQEILDCLCGAKLDKLSSILAHYGSSPYDL